MALSFQINETVHSAGQPARTSRPRLGWLLLIAPVLALPYVFTIAFSGFEYFDDEGTLLTWFRSFDAGERMYDDIFTLYGPVYTGLYGLLYAGLGVPIEHSAGRSLASLMWLGCGVGYATIGYRITRSIGVAALCFVMTLTWLRPMMHSPGHPEELGLVLMAAAVLPFASLGQRPAGQVMALLGAVLAALVLVKINLGAFVGLGTVLTLLIATEAAPWQRAARRAASLALLVLPAVLLALLFAQPWVRLYCIVAEAMVAAVLLTSLSEPAPQPILRGRDWWPFWLGALAVTLVAVGGMMLAGSSAHGMLNTILFQNAYFMQNWFYRLDIDGRGQFAAALSLGAALACRLCQVRPGWQRFRLPLVAVLKAVFVLVGLRALANILSPIGLADPRHMMFMLMPFCWLLVIAPADTEPRLRWLRLVIALVGTTLVLYPFPVAGHQINIATLLTALLVPILAHDLLVLLTAATERWRPEQVPRLQRSFGVLACAAALLWLGGETYRSITTYVQLEPLGLPGTAGIRVAPRQAENFRWVNQQLASCAASYSMPQMASFGLWTGQKPATPMNVNAVLNLVPPDRQQDIIAALERQRDLCILYVPRLLSFFDRGQVAGNPPLLRYILTEFQPVASRERFIILKRRSGG